MADISKRQKVGKLETRKCVDKMYTLRERQQGKSEFQQQRAVSGRMITDIEMNGTLRGAVEEFNLCANLRTGDCLFAECIRTFDTVHVNAQQWLHRIEVEIEALPEMRSEVFVPTTCRPNVRSIRSKAPVVDLYAFRPLRGTPFAYLSPFEFLQYWDTEALTAPSWKDTNPRTEWTEQGKSIVKNPQYREGNVKLRPGVHYVVKEIAAGEDEFYTFDREPHRIFDVLRNSWVIVRRPRPRVPVLEGAPVPSPSRSPEANAKYFSVFFRPWTLLPKAGDIPHLATIGFYAAPGDTSALEPYVKKSFKHTWEAYIQGNVVSRHSVQLISSVMTNTLACKSHDQEERDEADRSDIDEDVPRLILQASDMRKLLHRVAGDFQDGVVAEENRPPSKSKPIRRKTGYTKALSLVHALWGRSETEIQDTPTMHERGPRPCGSGKEHVTARNQSTESKEETHPYSGKTLPRASLYEAGSGESLESWLSSLSSRQKAPTKEQLEFLRALVNRLLAEAHAEQSEKQKELQEEPLFDMIHGVPGSGKSQMIAWIREAFEQVLGWTHGIQFVCVAYQNAMAAHIDGYTVHHWTGIPVGEAEGTASTRDNHAFATRCQSLRFLLVDEISMISAQLFGQLELIMAKVIRRRSPYRTRSDGTSRPFGGVNVLLFGDWWQLKPVTGTALFSDPEQAPSLVALHGLRLLWGDPPNCVHHCWDFQQSMRCADHWYNHFLNKCRNGALDENVYNFLHGFPTAAPASFSEQSLSSTAQAIAEHGECSCPGRTELALHDVESSPCFYGPWLQRFLLDGMSGKELMAEECDACHSTRLQRSRVLSNNFVASDPLLHKTPFDTAPALYAYNVPRFYALMLRSRQYARSNNLRLHWCIARDVPLHREDRDLPDDQLREKRCRWLERHDQHTSHIGSQLPLVQGLPVRLTDAVDRKRALFRGRRGTIVGWVPHPEEEREEMDGDWILSHMPEIIYVHFPGATWTIHENLQPGVYPLTPVSRTWEGHLL